MVTNTDILKLKELYASLDRHKDAGEDVVADIIVYRGRVIAGDIQSITLDGFMSTLDYPKTA